MGITGVRGEEEGYGRWVKMELNIEEIKEARNRRRREVEILKNRKLKRKRYVNMIYWPGPVAMAHLTL